MCGHVGIAGNLEYKDERTMKALLMFDYFRGTDSTGLAAVQGNDVVVAKVASHPVDLFDTTRFTKACNAFKSSAFIGHNRAATKGAVNATNAHPYHCGHIVGAHNGTLSQKSWDALCEVLGEKTGTDSHAIFLCIEKIGIEETSKLLQGAWALVWVDTNEGTLNFLRNDQRPFWYSYTSDFKKVIWASEHWMIRAAVNSAPAASAYELFVSPENYSFWASEVDWHYRFDLEELKKGSSDRPKPKVKTLKGKEPEPKPQTFFPQSNSWVPGRTSGASTTSSSGGSTSTTTYGTSTDRAAAANLVRHIEGTLDKPYGDYMSKDEFDSLAKYGCSFCGEEVRYGDDGLVLFEKAQKVLGSCCSGSQASRIYGDPSRIAA